MIDAFAGPESYLAAARKPRRRGRRPNQGELDRLARRFEELADDHEATRDLRSAAALAKAEDLLFGCEAGDYTRHAVFANAKLYVAADFLATSPWEHCGIRAIALDRIVGHRPALAALSCESSTSR